MPRRTWPPDPPTKLLPARTVAVPGRGEFFLRDSGEPPGGGSLGSSAGAELPGHGQAVLLLHGWMATADLNWWGAYDDLVTAGYRVVALDHRGHGRGLRPLVPFRLSDCADDAAAVVRELGLSSVLVVGYSMGGAIAQLLAHNHSDLVAGLVLSGTAMHWQDPRTQRAFKALGALGLSLSIAPRLTYKLGFRRAGIPDGPRSAWVQSELMRHAAQDIAEAGRELGRFDSRPWIGQLRAPVSMVLTTRDELVAPGKQRDLAAGAGAQVFEVALMHLELGERAKLYNPALLSALKAVEPARDAAAA